ncbi:MAG: hypothetical protein LBO71_04240 [Prevotellaceae bacterium]|nr:hypothetical protein [Prevotellaceae bacterium]
MGHRNKSATFAAKIGGTWPKSLCLWQKKFTVASQATLFTAAKLRGNGFYHAEKQSVQRIFVKKAGLTKKFIFRSRNISYRKLNYPQS